MFKSVLFILLMTLSGKGVSKDLSDYIQYGAGYYSSVYIHELGHATAAKYFGATKIRIEVPRKGTLFSGATYYKLDTSTQNKEKIISLSGLIAGNLANEIVIQTSGLHSNSFAQGIASTAHATNLATVYNYYINRKANDIAAYEQNGGNPHILSTALVGYTLWSLKRMSDKNIPLFGIEYNF